MKPNGTPVATVKTKLRRKVKRFRVLEVVAVIEAESIEAARDRLNHLPTTRVFQLEEVVE